MRRRKSKPSFARAMAGPMMSLVALGLIWVAVQFDLHNAIGRALIAPLGAERSNGR